MKRFLIFALFFPLMAVVVWIVVSLPIVGFVVIPEKSVILPMAAWSYALGIVPAVLLALVDWFLAARLRLRHRIVSTALVGYVLALLSALTVFDRRIWLEILMFGLVGAIPAAVGSWLSGRKA